MEEKIIKKLSDIEKAIDNASIDLGVDLVDLWVVYDLEYELKELNKNIKSNSRVSSFQNIIMIILTIIITYLTYLMATS